MHVNFLTVTHGKIIAIALFSIQQIKAYNKRQISDNLKNIHLGGLTEISSYK